MTMSDFAIKSLVGSSFALLTFPKKSLPTSKFLRKLPVRALSLNTLGGVAAEVVVSKYDFSQEFDAFPL